MCKWECITFHELSKCLPVIEHLSFNCTVIECCFQDYAWRELPTALVNLKYIALLGTVLFDGSHLPLLCHVLRSSPNLEKIKLTDSFCPTIVTDQVKCDDMFISFDHCTLFKAMITVVYAKYGF
nr:hypothetical protein [Tanacetum cinerariifolium]